jgi:hypothetical protein
MFHLEPARNVFAGLAIGDADPNDTLTLTISFDAAGGDLVLPPETAFQAATDPATNIKAYTFIGTASQLNYVFMDARFQPNQENVNTGEFTTGFTISVQDDFHGPVTDSSLQVVANDEHAANEAATIAIQPDAEITTATHTGGAVNPFAGVIFNDGEDADILTVKISFVLDRGNLLLSDGTEPPVDSDNQGGDQIYVYTFTGTKADLTDLIASVQFVPSEFNSGTVETVFDIRVKDDLHAYEYRSNAVKVISTDGPPTINIGNGWETWELAHTADSLSIFYGVTIDGEDGQFTVAISFDPEAGDVVFPSYAEFQVDVDPQTGFKTYTFSGTKGDLNSLLMELSFDPNQENANIDPEGGITTVITISLKDENDTVLSTGNVTVLTKDELSDNLIPTIDVEDGTETTETTHTGTDVFPFTGVSFDDYEDLTITVSISFDINNGDLVFPDPLPGGLTIQNIPHWESGLMIYRITGNEDAVTSLIRQVQFDPDDSYAGSGPVTTRFDIRVSDDDHSTSFENSEVTVIASDPAAANQAPTGITMEGGTVLETAAVGTEFATLTAQDPDPDDTFTYALVASETDETEASNPLFEIEGDKIVLKAGLDDPQVGTYDLWVKVTDAGGLSTVQKVTVTVANVNEAPTDLLLSGSIANESDAPVRIGTLSASDVDGDTLTYILVDEHGDEIADSSIFEIQSIRVNGQVVHWLATKAGVQVAADEMHDVHIKAIDGHGGSVTEKFTITIKNVVPPNSAPEIIVAPGLAMTLATDTGENVHPFAGVSFDDAEDDDLTVTITFDPAGGDLVLPAGVQVTPSVDPETGLTTYTFNGKKATLAALMDTLAFDPVRETGNSGTVTTAFTISVQDASHAPVMNESVQVVTTITDKNSAPANLQLDGSAEGVTVAESATEIGALSADDADGNVIQWVFAQDGNPGGMFVIDGNRIKLAGGKQLDVDGAGGMSSYTIHVKANDGNGGETAKTFVIAVTNVNDNAPATIRLNGRTSLDVAESTKVGDLIGTLTATDADGDAIVSYDMEASAFFEIVRNAETGAFEVRLKAGVDYEEASQRTHVLRITAFDGQNTSAIQDVTIHVADMNEAPTGLVAEGGLADDLSVSEHTAVGAVIAALSGQDPDEGETFTYTLVTDATGAAAGSHPFFEIVGDKILLKANLDDAQIGPYDLWVKVTDAGGLSTVRKVTITVANVDEAPVGLVVTGGTVAEHAPLHAVAATLAGLDPDAGDTFSYRLVTDAAGATDATHALFELVDNQIRVKAGLDDAQVGAYDLWVKVIDASGLSTVQKVTITVTNANESPTGLLLSNTVVYESGSAMQIGTLSATDVDGDTLRYDIVDASGEVTDDTPFEILTVSANGEIRLATKAGIQVESDETHVIRIKVSDRKGGSFIEDFQITIKNVNAAPTNITLSNTVVDESGAAIKVGTLNATDADGDELTYILVDANGTEVTDTSPFEIQEIRANGVKIHRLATKTGIQVDADETRDVWIRVSDGKGSVTQKFTVTIRDVADMTVNKAPTLFIATDAATVRATDLDGPINPFMGVSFDDAEDDVLSLTISFNPAGGDLALTPETWATSVAIDPETGVKTYAFTGRKAELAALMDRLSFDPVQQPGNSGTIKTVFTISVKDPLHEAVSDSSVSVVTTIINKNHAPESLGLNGSFVFENSGAGTLVGTLSAHDPDAGDTLVYTLTDDRFYIDGNQLRVKEGAKLDFEAAQSHQITIQVSDGETSVGQTYTISIGDMVETLTGTKGKDLLRGGAGSDVIKGEYGNDTLLGDGGQDFFVFKTKLGTSKTDRKVNFDTIKDFKVVDDSIWLDDKIFKNAALKKLGKGASEANPKQVTSKFFKISDKAKDKDDYIIYNKKTGVLSYDADGSGSKYKAVEFANIGKNLALTSKDFFII